MATRIKEGMTGAEVAQIIDNGFDNLEELNQRVEINETVLEDIKNMSFVSELMGIGTTKEEVNINYRGMSLGISFEFLRTIPSASALNAGVMTSDDKTILDGLASKENLIIPVDEEDITSESGALKFKDREYDEANFSGKGYKILRKNIQDDKNILTLDMVNEANTVYEVRYDFDLNGATINIPDSCLLYFNGGDFKNGIINIAGECYIDTIDSEYALLNITIDGIIDCINFSTDNLYFDGTDDSKLIDSSINHFNNILYSTRDYHINDGNIHITRKVNIDFNHNVFHVNPHEALKSGDIKTIFVVGNNTSNSSFANAIFQSESKYTPEIYFRSENESVAEKDSDCVCSNVDIFTFNSSSDYVNFNGIRFINVNTGINMFNDTILLNSVSINNCDFINCFFGIGGNKCENLIIRSCVFSLEPTTKFYIAHDIYNTNSAKNWIIENCKFISTNDNQCSIRFRGDASYPNDSFIIKGCKFYGNSYYSTQIEVVGSYDSAIVNTCDFIDCPSTFVCREGNGVFKDCNITGKVKTDSNYLWVSTGFIAQTVINLYFNCENTTLSTNFIIKNYSKTNYLIKDSYFILDSKFYFSTLADNIVGSIINTTIDASSGANIRNNGESTKLFIFNSKLNINNFNLNTVLSDSVIYDTVITTNENNTLSIDTDKYKLHSVWINDILYGDGTDLPEGGTVGQVLKKTASGVEWANDNNTTYTKVTTSADGLMSKEDKTKLDDIAENANNYTLPVATSDVLGGIKLGYTQKGTNYPVQLDSNNKAYINVNTLTEKVSGTGVNSILVVEELPDPQQDGVLYIVTGKEV